LTDEGLKAVFGYLRTLPPIGHRVDNTELRTLCKVCGEMHGAGERNWSNRMAPPENLRAKPIPWSPPLAHFA
jgi:hypothetical protein